MAYNSYSYLILFLGLTLILYYLFPKKAKWVVLLAASYVFYIISCGKYIVFPIMTTITVYVCGIWLEKINASFELKKKDADKETRKALKKKANAKKKAVSLFFALGNLGVLIFLKYFNFLSTNVQLLAQKIGGTQHDIKLLSLVLPLGISFYTLQAVSYIVDVYRGTIKADRNIGRLGLFICFFPSIVEGPITRYNQMADQLYEGHPFDTDNFRHGAEIIIWGLFKKVVIADRLSMFVDEVFKNYADNSGLVIATAVLFYTIQIYCDFSGCIDIAAGSSYMMGIKLPQNFRHPMYSKSINEFWRRWHITLGTWLKDYVFYPISLSKPIRKLGKWSQAHIKGHLGTILPATIALFFVWFCNGLWHGASWKYIFYGLYYYIIMTLGNVFEPVSKSIQSKLKINTASKGYGAFEVLRTFILVNIGMLIFRAVSLRASVSIFASMFRGSWISALTDGTLLNYKLDKFDFIVIALSVVIMIAVSVIQEKGKSITDIIARQKLPVRWLIYLAGIFTVIIFGAYGPDYDVAAMIYAQF